MVSHEFISLVTFFKAEKELKNVANEAKKNKFDLNEIV